MSRKEPATIGDNSAPDAFGQLRAFIDRIMRLKEEQDTISGDIREIYAEAKGSGFDKTAMGQLVGYLRKKGKNAAKLEEQSAIFDLYLEAYERPSHARAREGARRVAQAEAAGQGSAPVQVSTPAPAINSIPEAKASEDNAITAKDRTEVGTDGPGDASRPSVGGGSDAPIPPEMANDVLPQHSGFAPVEGSGHGEDCESVAHETGVTGESRTPTPVKRQDDVPVAEAVATVEAHRPSEVEGPAPIRRMSMSPLGPRELGGLEGFGFTVNFEHIPVPHYSAAADGQRSTPSDPVAGAKSDGIPVPASDGAGPWPESHNRQGLHAVTLSPSSEPISSPAETKAADAPPPASAAQFKRTVAYWRPHCLKPDACGSAKLAHCRTCAAAAGLEVAA